MCVFVVGVCTFIVIIGVQGRLLVEAVCVLLHIVWCHVRTEMVGIIGVVLRPCNHMYVCVYVCK